MSKYSLFIIMSAFLLLSCSDDDGDEQPSSSSTDEGAVLKEYNAPKPPESEGHGDDPLLNKSWHLSNFKQKSYALNPPGVDGEDVGLGSLHQEGIQGDGVSLAFSDNGIEITHPDLWFNHRQGKSRNYSYSSPKQWSHKTPDPLNKSSTDAHGTAVAGLAVASAQNGIGSRGLAPKASFAGFLYVGPANTYAKMLDQAHGDFDIFNYSYGRNSCRFSSVPSGYLEQLRFGVSELRDGLGAIYVKAAGNEYIRPRSECVEETEIDFYLGNAALEREHSSPFMIVVGGNNTEGVSSSYSTPGSSLWISAPAGEFGRYSPALISTDLMGCERGRSQKNAKMNSFESGEHAQNKQCHYTSTMNGTSASTPLVSAAVALMLEANPDLSWREVKIILAQTARQIDPSRGPTVHPIYKSPEDHIYQRGWEQNDAGFNFHNWYGFGALDVSAAVESAKEYTGELPKLKQTLNPDGSWKYESKDELALPVPDADAKGVEHEIYVAEDLSIEAIQIRLSVEHSFASDLGVELTSPAGTTSQLMTINSGIAEKSLNDVLLLSNAFLKESSQGNWTIRVIDGAEDDLGVLQNWKINIWGHKPEGSSPDTKVASQAKEQLLTGGKGSEIDVKLNKVELENATRGPGLPPQKKTASGQEPIKAARTKSLNTTGQINYEWLTYDQKLAEEKLREKEFKFVGFSLDKKLTTRLDVYSHGRSFKLMYRTLEKGGASWMRTFSASRDQAYVGVVWQSSDFVTIVTRDSKGTAYFWNVQKDGPVVRQKIETNLLRRLTQANVIKLDGQLHLLVWDDYFLHTWTLSKNSENSSHRPISFKGEIIQSVFEDSGKIYVWTTTSDLMNLWKIQGENSSLVRSRERNPREFKHFPLSRESLLVRDKENAVWLKIFKGSQELKEKLPGFPRPSGGLHIDIKKHVEGDILVLVAYEKQSKLFHQFKFYLDGRNDEE